MITSIRLQNFRSYRDTAFEFDPGVNIIVGPNGSGKTNLLESLLVICRGSSYRSKDNELLNTKKDWARIDMLSSNNQTRSVKYQRQGERIQKSFILDDKPLTRLNLPKQLPAVLFEPAQLLTFTSPELRRVFIDELLEQTDPTFASIKSSYSRALSQRNRLLKLHPPSIKEQVFVWNVRLSELGSQIATKRHQLITRLTKELKDTYQTIANTKDKLTINYKSKHPIDSYASSLLKQLESNLEKELASGFTLYGPHRDDIGISINNQLIQNSASRGEVRTVMLVLKMIEAKLIEEVREHKPIFLLDDVFGELDGSRRKALTKFLRDHQSFITTTDADIVLKSYSRKTKLIALS